MSVWKNITDKPLTFFLDGPGDGKVGNSLGPTVVEPGENLTCNDSLDYVVGSQCGHHQVTKVDPNAPPPAKK